MSLFERIATALIGKNAHVEEEEEEEEDEEKHEQQPPPAKRQRIQKKKVQFIGPQVILTSPIPSTFPPLAALPVPPLALDDDDDDDAHIGLAWMLNTPSTVASSIPDHPDDRTIATIRTVASGNVIPYKQWVYQLIEFYEMLSASIGLDFEVVCDIKEIEDHSNDFRSISELSVSRFDRWILNTTRQSYIMERAWAMAFQQNRSYEHYINIILDKTAATLFVEMCSIVYGDVRINTFQKMPRRSILVQAQSRAASIITQFGEYTPTMSVSPFTSSPTHFRLKGLIGRVLPEKGHQNDMFDDPVKYHDPQYRIFAWQALGHINEFRKINTQADERRKVIRDERDKLFLNYGNKRTLEEYVTLEEKEDTSAPSYDSSAIEQDVWDLAIRQGRSVYYDKDTKRIADGYDKATKLIKPGIRLVKTNAMPLTKPFINPEYQWRQIKDYYVYAPSDRVDPLFMKRTTRWIEANGKPLEKQRALDALYSLIGDSNDLFATLVAIYPGMILDDLKHSYNKIKTKAEQQQQAVPPQQQQQPRSLQDELKATYQANEQKEAHVRIALANSKQRLLDEQRAAREEYESSLTTQKRKDTSYLSAQESCLLWLRDHTSGDDDHLNLDSVIGDRLMRILFVELVALTHITFQQHVNSRFGQQHVLKRITNSREALMISVLELYKAGGITSLYTHSRQY
jgi:hypothetical protein